MQTLAYKHVVDLGGTGTVGSSEPKKQRGCLGKAYTIFTQLVLEKLKILRYCDARLKIKKL